MDVFLTFAQNLNSMYKQALLFTFLLISQLIFSQQGNVSGKVFDDEINDILPFASVVVKGTSIGESTDFDGKYNIPLNPGTYTLVFSFVGYTNVEISDVVITAGKETIVEAHLKQSSNTLEEVVVTTSLRKNTEKAMTKLQRDAATVVDGLSAQGIKSTGASNIAAAIKQVPGVSIEGGKFVVVRGLSDRYSKTTLNGLDVPGLDPDKNSLQVDLFPTNILENLVVSKTASADLPADFTGGIVDITLKDFSNRPEYTVSVGYGINPNQHFKSDYQSIEKGSTGFLGFNNERGKILNRNFTTPLALDANGLDFSGFVTELFNDELRAENKTNLGNVNFGITASNHIKFKNDNKLGYQANISYKSKTSFIENAIDNNYLISGPNNEILATRVGAGDISNHQTLLTALGGLSFKTDKAKYKLTGLFIRNGISQSSITEQAVGENGEVNYNRVVDENTYTEKTISNFLLSGNYKFDDWSIDWKLSPTFSKVHDLDHRTTPLRIEQNNNSGNFLQIDPASGTPFRIWRFLDETNLTSKIDVAKKYQFDNEWKGKLKFGGYSTLKDREFSLDQYAFSGGPQFEGDEANPNDLFLPENIASSSNINGFAIGQSQTFSELNAFDASQNTLAAYVMNETKFSDKFRASFGIRLENFKSLYTGLTGVGQLNNAELINVTDLFPSVNLVYSVTEKTNLRGSYSKSTARPSFREASTNDILDPVTQRRFIGALAFDIILQPTYIDNFDLRYEYYAENGDGFAISGFYKQFKNAIELVFPVTAATISPRNLDNAFLFGGEMEIRKNLSFIGLERFSTKFNASVVKSEVDVETPILGENNSTRTLQGQAPFNINFILEYRDDKDFVANLNYNVQGETLETVGSGALANVFTQPFHRLVLNTSKSYGKHKVSFKVTNLLNDTRESFFKHNNDIEIYKSREENRTFSIGYTYKF